MLLISYLPKLTRCRGSTNIVSRASLMFFGDILSVRCEILTHKYKGLEKPALV